MKRTVSAALAVVPLAGLGGCAAVKTDTAAAAPAPSASAADLERAGEKAQAEGRAARAAQLAAEQAALPDDETERRFVGNLRRLNAIQPSVPDDEALAAGRATCGALTRRPDLDSTELVSIVFKATGGSRALTEKMVLVSISDLCPEHNDRVG